MAKLPRVPPTKAPPEPEQELRPPPLPETIIVPLGLQINRVQGPGGTEVLMHFVAQGHVYTIRLVDESFATEIASKLAGGVIIAGANELSELPPAPEGS